MSPEDRDLAVRAMSIDEVRRLRPIPSGYRTDVVYRLTRESGRHGTTWSLQELALTQPFEERYDDGVVDEWMESYLETAPESSTRFLVAGRGRSVLGLLTWRRLTWNDTIWLIDIRTREAQRRQGVGSALVAELKRLAVAEGVRGIFVETQIRNMPALRFYMRHGFAITGFDDHLYSNDDLAEQNVAVFLYWERR